MAVSCSSGSHESTTFTVELGDSSAADQKPECWLVVHHDPEVLFHSRQLGDTTLPQLTLQLVSNLACQSALNYDFVATASRSTVISWCVVWFSGPFLPCGRKRRNQLTCMRRGSNNEAFFSSSLKCAELSPSGKCALQCKK